VLAFLVVFGGFALLVVVFNPLVAIIAWALMMIIVVPILIVRSRRIKNAGFEACGAGLWVKDGKAYVGHKLEKLVPIEIIKLSEVTRNSKLIELEIRYRINGEVKSVRVRGSQDQLLTYADRLGYS